MRAAVKTSGPLVLGRAEGTRLLLRRLGRTAPAACSCGSCGGVRGRSRGSSPEVEDAVTLDSPQTRFSTREGGRGSLIP